jgi:hypothetical protein
MYRVIDTTDDKHIGLVLGALPQVGDKLTLRPGLVLEIVEVLDHGDFADIRSYNYVLRCVRE